MAIELRKRSDTKLSQDYNLPIEVRAAISHDKANIVKQKIAKFEIGLQKIGVSTRNSSADLDVDQKLLQEFRPVWLSVTDAGVPELSLQPLQEWEGYVSEVRENTFTARLVDMTANQKIEDEIGEFSIEELSEDNVALLREGAVFRWVIGYQRSKAGTKRRVSEIVFRRLPAWTNRDLAEAKSRAISLVNDIVWE